jgi:hypothetical protein
MQEHLSLIMKDYRETKRELLEVKETLTALLRQGAEADKEMRLEKIKDLVKIVMSKFSEYCRSGKVWHN